jgi:hypothetical protein
MTELNSVAIRDKDWHFSVSKNFVTNNKLSVGARLLMVILRSFVGPRENSCFPGRDHLCDVLGANKDTVTKWLQELKDAGYLKITQEKGKGSRFSKNVYETTFSPCPNFPDTVPPDTEPPDTVKSPLICTTLKDVPLLEDVPSIRVKGELSKPEKKASFTKPSIEEVKAYAGEIGLDDNQAETFYDHFESNGWLVGGKTKMKDWNASLRNWKRNNDRYHAGRGTTPRNGGKVVPCAANDWNCR